MCQIKSTMEIPLRKLEKKYQPFKMEEIFIDVCIAPKSIFNII